MEKATREQSKSHNKALILNTIYQSENLSRADISRITHLTRSTVSEIIAELIEEGLVAETGTGKSAGGKPPVLLALVDDARQIIGIDLASGEFRGALINLRGDIQQRINFSIEDSSGEQALEIVFNLIDQLVQKASRPIIGIGIGAPGIMDSEKGVVITAVNLDWQNLPLVEILQDKYDIPVYIANDSQVSALAESKFGTTEKGENLLVVKIGRGVGSGIIIDNHLFQGDGFGAGEIGHIKVEDNGVQCRCGNFGCLETRISSRAIRKLATQLSLDTQTTALTPNTDGSPVTTEEVVAAFQAGDPEIIKIIRDAGSYLGQTLSFITSTLNINQVVIAGSVSLFGDGIIQPALDVLQGSTLPAIANQVKITSSSLGEEIVMLGAAGLVLHHELSIL